MYKPESALKNEAYKILWGDIKTDHIIPTKMSGQVLNKEKKRVYHPVDFAIQANNRLKMKGERQILGLCLRIEKKKLWEKKVTVISIMVCALGTVRKSLEKRLVELNIRIEIIHGDLKRLAVNQTPVNDHQLK